MTRAIFISTLAVALVGCAGTREKIPHYPRMSDEQSLQTIASRAEKTKTVTAEGLITLRDPDGQTVRLDAAIVMRPPEELRLRAWKFSQAVFDLTLTPQGAWLIAPQDPQRRAQVQTAGVGAAKLARTWAILAGGFFSDPRVKVKVMRSTNDRLLVEKEQDDGTNIFCAIDRATLTPRVYRLVDPNGTTRFELTLDHYAQFDDIVWPTRVSAKSDRGEILINLKTVEINGEIPDRAFVPPRRAEKLP
jgi:hypothetical protein